MPALNAGQTLEDIVGAISRDVVDASLTVAGSELATKAIERWDFLTLEQAAGLAEFEDDPNLTDKKFPGNPTHSFRAREPLRVVGELVDWVGHSSEKLQAMRDGVQRALREGTGQIED